jgi:metal-responsive CopG/Arc/MetJ family transcriptional regulator
MKRTLIDLEEKDLTELDHLAADWRTSRAAVLRDAVAEYLVKRERVTARRQRTAPVVKSTNTATVTVTAHRDLAGGVDFMAAEWQDDYGAASGIE